MNDTFHVVFWSAITLLFAFGVISDCRAHEPYTHWQRVNVWPSRYTVISECCCGAIMFGGAAALMTIR